MAGVTRIIISARAGLCLARAINCPLGCSVRFLPIELDCFSKQTLAAFCQPLNTKYLKVRDAVSGEFLISFTVKADEQKAKKHRIQPYGVLNDKTSLVEDAHIGKEITVVAVCAIFVNHRSVEWTVKSIEQPQASSTTVKIADAPPKSNPQPVASQKSEAKQVASSSSAADNAPSEPIPENALIVNAVVKSMKGDDIFMFSPSPKLPNAHFNVNIHRFTSKPQLGQWFELTCRLFDNSTQHLKVYQSKAGFCALPTEVVNGYVQLLSKVTVGAKIDGGFTYAYSPELRGIADVYDVTKASKQKDAVYVWCTPLLRPRDGIQWKVARLKEQPPSKLPDEPSVNVAVKTVDKSSRDSSTASAKSTNPKPPGSPAMAKKAIPTAKKDTAQEIRDHDGVVASESEKVFYIYCPTLEQEAVLHKTLVTGGDPMNLGAWIKFSAKMATDRYQITSFKRTPPKYPTMPSLNSILIECQILLPLDYSVKNYKGVVQSDFIPKVADVHGLIHKDYCGKFLKAVIRRGRNAMHQDIPWVIEYIYI